MSEKKQLTIWLDSDLYEKLKKMSKLNFTTITGMVKLLIREKND